MAEQPKRDQAEKIKEEFKDKAPRSTTDPKDEDARRDNPIKERIRDEAEDPDKAR
jgi:hypothetical protein